jgi:hypothetical protein
VAGPLEVITISIAHLHISCVTLNRLYAPVLFIASKILTPRYVYCQKHMQVIYYLHQWAFMAPLQKLLCSDGASHHHLQGEAVIVTIFAVFMRPLSDMLFELSVLSSEHGSQSKKGGRELRSGEEDYALRMSAFAALQRLLASSELCVAVASVVQRLEASSDPWDGAPEWWLLCLAEICLPAIDAVINKSLESTLSTAYLLTLCTGGGSYVCHLLILVRYD